MTALKLILTDAGMNRFTEAQLGNPIDLTVAEIGLTAQEFYAAPTLTALPGLFRRVGNVSGEVVGDNIAHIVMRDDAEVGYTVRGFGLFLQDGTLLAAYGQPTPIFEKSPATTLLMPLDLAFPNAQINSLTFGNTNFLNPPSTTETAGIVYLATLAEADAGDTRRVTTGAIVKAMIAAAVAGFQTTLDNALAAFGTTLNDAIGATGQAFDGLAARTAYGSGLVKGGGRNDTNRTFTVDAATGDQVRAGTDTNVAVTPAALALAGVVYLVEQKTDGANRYRRYSDGVTEMSGVAALPTAESTFTLSFPWPFPTECEGVWSTIINSAQTNDGQSTVQEVALAADHATLFAQNHKTPTTDAAGGFRWLARGR